LRTVAAAAPFSDCVEKAPTLLLAVVPVSVFRGGFGFVFALAPGSAIGDFAFTSSALERTPTRACFVCAPRFT
jgi:hypothetical protein